MRFSFILFLIILRKGGLIFKAGGSNMQHVTSLSFLLLTYSNYLSHANKVVPCGETTATPALLKRLAKRQVKIHFYCLVSLFMWALLYLDQTNPTARASMDLDGWINAPSIIGFGWFSDLVGASMHSMRHNEDTWIILNRVILKLQVISSIAFI